MKKTDNKKDDGAWQNELLGFKKRLIDKQMLIFRESDSDG